MTNESTQVVIVGGGVVGLSASLFLLQHGVRAVLAERHPTTCIHPRARGVNGRTMELLRELGLEAAVRKAGESLAPAVGLYSGATLAEVIGKKKRGGLLREFLRRRAFGDAPRWSPTGGSRCTQDALEPVLLDAIRARGGDARLHTEVTDVSQDADGVTATLLDRGTGAIKTVRADYLIAADGARSPIRTRLGVSTSGRGGLTHHLNLYFRADLSALVKGREFSMCLIENGDLRGMFASINNADLWVFHVCYYPERGERPEDFPPERCVALIRQGAGVPDLEVELKGALPWQSAVRVVDQYQHGRLFLAGDAAHVMPPWGGFGANTGIQDAHNLAWKLAAVLKREAGPELLATYDVERRPVARVMADIAGDLNDERGLMRFGSKLQMLAMMRRVLRYSAIGYGYASSAVALEPGPAPGPGSTDLRGRPGTRLPHVWLSRKGAPVSTLDLLGARPGLVLLSRNPAWCDAAQAAARRAGVPLHAYRIGAEDGVADVADPKGRWASSCGVSKGGAVLVRPDGIVAWRSRGALPSPEDTLHRALSALLARGAPAC